MNGVGREVCLDLAVQVYFCHSNYFFPMSQWCFCANLVKIHQLVQEIRVQTRLIFTVFIVWWPWKLGQGHQNLIKSLNHRNVTIHEVWPECVIWSTRSVWPCKWGQGHQSLITSFPCPNNVSVQVWSKSTHWFRHEAMWMLTGSAPKAMSLQLGGHNIKLFHGCLVNSQNYSPEVLRTARCTFVANLIKLLIVLFNNILVEI